MPMYDLQCPGCGHKWSDFAPMAHRHTLTCPCCQHAADTDWERTGVPRIQRTWHDRESVAMSYGVDPEDVRETVALRGPSWEFNAEGDAVFRNDQHMRKCLTEWEQREQQRAETDPETRKAIAKRDRRAAKSKATAARRAKAFETHKFKAGPAKRIHR